MFRSSNLGDVTAVKALLSCVEVSVGCPKVEPLGLGIAKRQFHAFSFRFTIDISRGEASCSSIENETVDLVF